MDYPRLPERPATEPHELSNRAATEQAIVRELRTAFSFPSAKSVYNSHQMVKILLTGDVGSGKRALVSRAAKSLGCTVCECTLLSAVRSKFTWTDEAIEEAFRKAIVESMNGLAQEEAKRDTIKIGGGRTILLFSQISDLIPVTRSVEPGSADFNGNVAYQDARRSLQKFVQCMSKLELAMSADPSLRIAVLATTDSESYKNMHKKLRDCFSMSIALPNFVNDERASFLNEFLSKAISSGNGTSSRAEEYISVADLDQAVRGKALSCDDLVAIGSQSLRKIHSLQQDYRFYKPRNGQKIMHRDIFLETARNFVPSSRRTHHAATSLNILSYSSNFTELQNSAEFGHLYEKNDADHETGWSAVGGLAEAKRALVETVIWSYTRRTSLLRLGIKPSKGVLLYGPPGTGKTLLASIAAKEAGINFVAVSFTDLIRSAVGESEAAIAAMFAEARENSPCILFIDEIQAIFGNRDDSGKSAQNMVSQLLQEIDGLSAASRGIINAHSAGDSQHADQLEKHVVVLAATNAPHALDKALLRPGRIDRQVYVGLPDTAARLEICESLSRKIMMRNSKARVDVNSDLLSNVEEIANRIEGFSGADITALYQRAIGLALSDSVSLSCTPEISCKHIHRVLDQGFLPSVSSEQVEALKKWANSNANRT